MFTKKISLLYLFIVISCTCFASEELYTQAGILKREGKYDEAIANFKKILTQHANVKDPTSQELSIYTNPLVQIMNAFQSKGEPEKCITFLQETFKESHVMQTHCLRDYYSVLGYALSRTEDMEHAEETILKSFTIPYNQATPERYFRDYAYAAAVFYSNTSYQKEVIDWCEGALVQAELSNNISGKQWVTAMLGSIYKKNGNFNKALELFQQSKSEAQERNDYLGVQNSLQALMDLFLYWDVPEYANMYATEAIRTEKIMNLKNPMVSAQTYINKGRALQQLGYDDSVLFYITKAREICNELPYNSGMVDVDLLHGIHQMQEGGDSQHSGMQKLQKVATQGTEINRAKAYHHMAIAYLENKKYNMAEVMLDSMYYLLNGKGAPLYININYEPILNYYLKNKKQSKVEQYIRMMVLQHNAWKEKKVHYNLVETITDLQNEQHKQEMKISHLQKTNQKLWFMICTVLSAIIISAIIAILIYQKKKNLK